MMYAHCIDWPLALTVCLSVLENLKLLCLEALQPAVITAMEVLFVLPSKGDQHITGQATNLQLFC